MQPTEAQLSFERSKQHWLPASLVYRGSRLARQVFGPERVLRFQLRASKVFWRVAFETSVSIYDESFSEFAWTLTPELLARWIPRGSQVLDIGCGLGRIARAVAPWAKSVRGIDLNAEVVREARQRTAHLANVSFDLVDANSLPNEKFDVAILSHVIEHIDDPEALLRRLRAIARKLVIEVPEFGREPLDWVRLDLGIDFSTDPDHVREYTREMLKAQLARVGWRVSEWASGRLSFAALVEIADSA